MPAQLIYPIWPSQGREFERLAHFAARRARTMKTHDELWKEVNEKESQRGAFLHAILQEEWSLDVAEMNFFAYDITEEPSWLMTEFLRHRLIAREWSFEQRSKRAIHGERIPVINPYDMHKDYEMWSSMNQLAKASQNLMERAHKKGYPSEVTRYACLEGAETCFVAGANARTLHHLFTLRGSKDIGGDGKAAPEFLALADSMYQQAREICPLLFDEVLRS